MYVVLYYLQWYWDMTAKEVAVKAMTQDNFPDVPQLDVQVF